MQSKLERFIDQLAELFRRFGLFPTGNYTSSADHLTVSVRCELQGSVVSMRVADDPRLGHKFERRIVKRTPCGLVRLPGGLGAIETYIAALECGHTVVRNGPDNTQTLHCAECVHNWLASYTPPAAADSGGDKKGWTK
jgi:hypothetical protein